MTPEQENSTDREPDIESDEQLLGVQQALGRLPSLACPDRVIEAVERELAVERRAEPKRTVRYAVLSLAIAAGLALAIVPSDEPPTPTPEPQQADQVAEARRALGELRAVAADKALRYKLRHGVVLSIRWPRP